MLIYKKLLCNWMGLVLLALGCLFYLSYGYLKASEQKKSLVIHAYKVLIHTSKLKFQLQELELSFHHYTLTGDPKFRRRLKRSAALAEAELAMFRRLTLDNIGMRPLSESIKLELDERIKFYEDNMYLPASAVQTALLKNVVLPDINAKYDQIEEAELRLSHTRQTQAERSAANFAFLFCAIVSFALLVVAYLYYGSRLASKKIDLLTVEIAESKSASEVLFDWIGDVLFTRDVNRNTFLEISNACEAILGYCASDFIEQKFLWLKITHPADRHMLSVGQRQLENGESLIHHYRIIHKNGSIRWIENSIIPTLDGSGMLVKLGGITRDITEKKLAELDRERLITELIRQNTAFEHFGYEVSHNLRAPVANIIGLSEILESLDISTKQLEVVGHLKQSVCLLDKKIRKLNVILSVKEQVVQEHENIYFNKLLKDVKDRLECSLKKKSIKVFGNFVGAEWIFSNRTSLYSIFYNLIASGITNRREGAVTDIYIESIIKGNYLEVIFIDNGQLTHSGISFGRFGLYQYLNDGLINPNMGLFMVKHQIEVLGGTFHIKSDLNVVTEFSILFPLKENTLSLRESDTLKK